MGNAEFDLNSKQYKDLSTIISKFGGDIADITEGSVDEAKKPDVSKMTTHDIEQGGNVVVVDKSIIDGLEEFINAGIDAKDWYTEMNQKILSSLGDSDGAFFLILMAIFSPRNTLQQNFRLASQVYVGVKKDLADPHLKKVFEEMLNETNLYDILKSFMSMSLKNVVNTLKGKRSYRDLNTVKGVTTGVRNVNAYLPNLIRVLRLYKSKGYAFNRKDVVDELSKFFNQKTMSVGKDTIVSGEKVLSFTLNLLDPEYQFESGWMPVTIDTWMAAFYYPYLNSVERGKLLALTKNYSYLAKLTTE